MTTISTTSNQRVERPDDRPARGSWWWVTDPDEKKPDLARWLGCVVEVGSNYAEVKGVDDTTERLSLDQFHGRCEPEPDVATYIATKIGFHTHQVRTLTEEIRSVCHRLGVPVRDTLADPAAREPDEPASHALATVSSTANVKSFKHALVKARDKTLPELFQQIEAQHRKMAQWMKADLIPAYAELERHKSVVEVIEHKIHTVELYAGLTEELVQIRKGEPAPIDTKIHLMQRRHYMDEECLARYEAGGMTFEEIGDFDRWISRDENFTRLLPHDRCIVGFRIRRYRYNYGSGIDPFVRMEFDRENKSTFLYLRNGRQLWRLETSIEFDEELFPSRASHDLLGDDELWIAPQNRRDLITGRQYAAKVEARRVMRCAYARKLWQWHNLGKPKKWTYIAVEGDADGLDPGTKTTEIHGRPWEPHQMLADRFERYEFLTPDHIYYDDAIAAIRQAAFEHNRIAVIVQGLLDRSTCFHPHPPWRIWTPEGFAAGVELTYDQSQAIATGDPISWKDYQKQLNRSLVAGVYTIGQCKIWESHMADRYGHKWQDYTWGDPGPKKIDRVVRVSKGRATFTWMRDRRRGIWVPASRPGYVKKAWPQIQVSWSCPVSELTCISAYTPGDYRMFYGDPRTQANYLQWAPVLLAAEDWHHARRMAEQQEIDAAKKARKQRPQRSS